MKNYIYLNGKKIPLSDETANQMAESFKKDQLETFKDCWNKVNGTKKPIYFLDSGGNISECRFGKVRSNHVSMYEAMVMPRRELVRKVQLYIQLVTVAEAVNDGWTFNYKLDEVYSYIYMIGDNQLHINNNNRLIGGDIMFKNKETAAKALKICPELWKEYLSIL